MNLQQLEGPLTRSEYWGQMTGSSAEVFPSYVRLPDGNMREIRSGGLMGRDNKGNVTIDAQDGTTILAPLSQKDSLRYFIDRHNQRH